MTQLATERAQRIAAAGLDAVVCLLPHHVLMLSGYRPRLGSGIAVATRDGRVAVALPSDEVDFARAAGIDNPIGYETVTLGSWTPVADALGGALRTLAERLRLSGRIGFEAEPVMTPNAYVSTLHLGGSLGQVLQSGLSACESVPADSLLRELQGHKTITEIGLLRQACALGERAFVAARAVMTPGRTEYELAGAAMAALAGCGAETWSEGTAAGRRAVEQNDRGGDVWVMSGPNSALAYRAFAKTGTRRLEEGDFVLVHMNPQVGGIWADITRTFVLGRPDARRRAILEAVLAARTATRHAMRDGAAGRDVDAAARAVLTARGYGAAFKHGLGHGIGFDGISAGNLPSLHPLSEDRLGPGMCFNAEPAVYIDGLGGCRHCDALALSEHGPEELTPFLSSEQELIVPC
jgi:Xaa-Pro aminopeptidase